MIAPLLRETSRALLDPRTGDEEATRACRVLYDRLMEATALRRDEESTRTADGLAIAPVLAANCLLDGPRTAALARGVLNAIRAERGGAPVEVVYAGTGPFAPLALLVMPQLAAGEAAFTLLDLHPESVRCVRALVDALGFAEQVREVACADATRYRHARPVDVLISETMQRSLAEEPFVAIVRNVRPQLSARGRIVPERVTVQLVLVDAPADASEWRSRFQAGAVLGEVFAIDKHGEAPAEVTLSVPPPPQGAPPKWLALETRVHAGGGAVLAPYASGLTTPEVLGDCSPVTGATTVTFRYEASGHPRLRWQRSTPAASPL